VSSSYMILESSLGFGIEVVIVRVIAHGSILPDLGEKSYSIVRILDLLVSGLVMVVCKTDLLLFWAM
jgi:hypothetical protein